MRNFRLSSDDVHGRIGPYHSRLLKCVRNAWKRWSRDHAPKLPGCRISPMRQLVQELIVQEIRAEFQNDPAVEIIETRQHHFLLSFKALDGFPAIHIRFKHLDDQKLTSNFQTDGSIAYDRHEPIELIPSGLRLNLGYRTDASDAELLDVLITRSHGPTKILWDYALWERGADVSHMPPAQRNLPGTGRRATPKPSAQSKRKKGGKDKNKK